MTNLIAAAENFSVTFRFWPKIPKSDIAMGEAILAPGDDTDVQLLNSQPTSSFVSSILYADGRRFLQSGTNHQIL